ncbi:hypothetical protein C8R43DRAFT_962878 [Mycena crocata]|nr:hypothetical protein C8R43DRAFT_962878 [Mycena crocata]
MSRLGCDAKEDVRGQRISGNHDESVKKRRKVGEMVRPTTAVLHTALCATGVFYASPPHCPRPADADAARARCAHGHMVVAGGQTRYATHPGDSRALDAHAASFVGNEEQR